MRTTEILPGRKARRDRSRAVWLKEKMMTKEDAAAALNGSEYGSEGSKELFAEMKAAGLVAVFGASYDLVEFHGAIEGEDGCYGGGEVLLDRAGLIPEERDNDWEDSEMLVYLQRKKSASRIEAKWDDGTGYSWTYATTIPHATFDVVETDGDDRELYCQGIVFALADLRS